MKTINNSAAPLDAPPRLVIVDLCAPSILERIIREAEPYLKRAAAYIAEEFPAARDDRAVRLSSPNER